MIEVVSPRIESQLGQSLEIEPRGGQEVGVGFGQEGEGLTDQLRIFSAGNTRTGDKERDRANLLMAIRFVPPVFEHRQRTVTNIIVEPLERLADVPLGLVPRTAGQKNCFRGTADE